MADQIYKVRDPAGNIREISGPAGASDEEIISQAKALFTPKQPERQQVQEKPMDPSEGGLPFRPFGLDTGMTMPQGVSRFLAGAGAGLTNIGRGAAQMVGAGPSSQEVQETRQRDRPLMNTGAGIAGNLTAGIAASLPAMAVPGANTVAGYGALGGIMGALEPTTQDENRLSNAGKGAALGVAIPSVANGIGAVGRLGRNIVDPWLPGGVERAVARTANEAAGPDKQAIIQALRNPQQIVPGSMPTAGEAAANVGRAEFSGLQEAVKGRLPSEYESVAQAQNAARVKAMRSVSQDKSALDKAVTDRAIAGEKNYGAVANDIVIPVDKDIIDILGRPSMRKAIDRAEVLASESGTTFPKKLTDGMTVDNAQSIKMALDDLTKNPERFGIGASEVNAIGKTREAFVNWLSKESPKWDAARSAYAADSRPINQMEVGQYLEGKLIPALNDLGASGNQRAGMYAQAMRDAPGTLKRATGQPRYDELGQILDPSQLGTVTGIGKDLARTAEHERLAQAGMERARDLVGQVTPKVPAAGMFNPHYSVMRAVINRLEGKVEGKSLDKLASAMQNPQEMARIMEGMSPKTRSMMARLLSESRTPILGGTIYSVEGAR